MISGLSSSSQAGELRRLAVIARFFGSEGFAGSGAWGPILYGLAPQLAPPPCQRMLWRAAAITAFSVVQRRMGIFFVGEQFVEHQAVRLFALAPENHQHNNFEFI